MLAPGDFAYGDAEWVPAAEGRMAGRRLWATPAPTHGPSLLDAMGDAAPGDDAGALWDRIQAVIQRRNGALADPRHLADGTSMVSAADADGNAVVVVHSNSFPRFGSGIVTADYDLVLNNRAGRGFTAEPGHPNGPEPGRRPATTLHAWAWSDEAGGVALLGATPGGENQMPWNAQALSQLVAGEREPGMLVTAPRWEWLPEDGGARVEEGLPPADRRALEARAPSVTEVQRWGLSSAQQVVARPVPGAALIAAADPRTGGAVVAV